MTRVTLTLCTLEKCIEASDLPLMLGLVTRMRFDTNGWSCCSQSTLMTGPIKAMMASASASVHTMYSWSPLWNTVLRLGMDTWPSCRMREHTKSRFRKS